MRLLSLIAVLVLAPTSAWAGCDDDGDGHAKLSCGGDDCDDGDAARYPGAIEICDEAGKDEDCNVYTPGQRDVDGDGWNDDVCVNYTTGGAPVNRGKDCDDHDITVHPDQSEVCNGIDDNCDGNTDEGLRRRYWKDEDGDGFGAAGYSDRCPNDSEGYAERGGDCDDGSAAIFPGMQVCDVKGGGVSICTVDGTWDKTTCDTDQICVDQPNDLGVCILDAKALKDDGKK